jgi:hypothetical protein
MVLKDAGQGKNVSDIVVHNENSPTSQHVVRTMEAIDHVAFGLGQFGHDPMKE